MNNLTAWTGASSPDNNIPDGWPTPPHGFFPTSLTWPRESIYCNRGIYPGTVQYPARELSWLGELDRFNRGILAYSSTDSRPVPAMCNFNLKTNRAKRETAPTEITRKTGCHRTCPSKGKANSKTRQLGAWQSARSIKNLQVGDLGAWKKISLLHHPVHTT